MRPLFFAAAAEGNLRCALCPSRCSIPDGKFGACGVRGSKGGKGIIPFYGFISALALDPIEKKPLYHFKPGSQILSVGFTGCNFRCPFCQNWSISQNTDIPGRWMKPPELISAALEQDSPSIAYTYSEPLVHAEYLIDCMTLARKHNIANVLVTNGCVNAEAAASILENTDAANIDLKSFSAETYSKNLGGDLETTLEFIKRAYMMGVHVEITTLMVPGLNDSEDELNAAADFIASLSGPLGAPPDGDSIPWHLSAYHPDYRWNAPATESGFLLNAAKTARQKLRYVYTGNIAAGDNNTYCECGALLIRRRGYHTEIVQTHQCVDCGKLTGIVE